MDLYKILGVDRNATPEDIKRAFREKAKKYHPDINHQYSEYFKQITYAYDILIDPEKRERYDKTLKEVEKRGITSLIGDLLSEFLGYHSKPINGEDIKVKLKIPVEDGYYGCIKKVEYTRKATCPDCNGTGLSENSKVISCETCKTTGRVKKLFVEIPCLNCYGTGYKVINPCPTCKGNKRIKRKETKLVQIPAGITPDDRVILEGGGNCGLNGGDDGDLIIDISFEKGRFSLNGLDLVLRVKVERERLLNANFISVKDIQGRTVKIPITDGTTRYRVEGRGYRDTTGKKGDLIVEIIAV